MTLGSMMMGVEAYSTNASTLNGRMAGNLPSSPAGSFLFQAAILATFASGKRYNCDLNASYNIAVHYWAWKLKLTRRKDGQLPEDRSSLGKPGMPVTLSTLWLREREAPHQCAA
jgi:hypothetical protein